MLIVWAQRFDPTTLPHPASLPNSREIQAAYGDTHWHIANAHVHGHTTTALTILGAQQMVLQNGGAAAPSPSPTATPAATGSPAPLNALTPQFSITAGQSPDGNCATLYPRFACSYTCAGTGNCIGINDIKILCRCPPSLASFLTSLHANIAVEHGVCSLGISVLFPHGRCPHNPVPPH